MSESNEVRVNLGHATAYADAVANGYTGTREQFGRDQANFANNAQAAESAKTAAETAAQNASNSADAAAKSAQTAGNAKTAAETAKTAAETAKSAAETAKTAAESAKTAAETAKTDAVTAKTDASKAKDDAVTAKNQAASAATSAGNSASAAASSSNQAANSATTAGEAASAATNAANNAATSASAAKTSEQNAERYAVEARDKLPKPVNQPVNEGYVYQHSDGTTHLIPAGDGLNAFKISLLVDNGADGTPGAVEYLDDAFGMTQASMSSDGVLTPGDWANHPIYNYFRPCVIAPGASTPAYFLDKNDLSKKEDGSDAVLTGEDGDVMVQVKKLYGRFVPVGNKVKITIMNYRETADDICFTKYGDVEYDYAYRGRYKAGVAAGDSTNTMRSISGVMPMVFMTRATARTRAKARGDEYHQNDIYLLWLWQAMYLFFFKTRQSQTALGQGRTKSSNTAAVACGWSDAKPWIWGNQNGEDGVVFLGVEDFYGNVWEWVDGAVLDKLTYKLTQDPSKYNDTGANYEISVPSGLTAAANNGKYLTRIQGTNECGFLPKNSGETGSGSNAFWCDYMWLAEGAQVVCFGGHWYTGASAGAFCWSLNHSAGDARAYIGSRLCRKNLQE